MRFDVIQIGYGSDGVQSELIQNCFTSDCMPFVVIQIGYELDGVAIPPPQTRFHNVTMTPRSIGIGGILLGDTYALKIFDLETKPM